MKSRSANARGARASPGGYCSRRFLLLVVTAAISLLAYAYVAGKLAKTGVRPRRAARDLRPPRASAPDASAASPATSSAAAPPAPPPAAAAAAAAPSPLPRRKRLALVVLCRESDVGDLVKTVRSHRAAYVGPPSGAPFPGDRSHDLLVFSDTAWAEPARAALVAATPARVRFVTLDAGAWGTPASVDRARLSAVLASASYYGNTEAYRRMCRFFAGPLWTLPVVREYEWVWRLDSHVRYLCDLPGDPVAALEAANATYGYALTMTELMATIPTLWETVAAWGRARGPAAEANAAAWGASLAPGSGAGGRGCHFWNNMEIARVDFFSTGSAYQELFAALDASGGFFYERWGDAPVRSWALLLLARPEHVLWFDIGYQHPWWAKAPSRWPADKGSCPGREFKPDPEIMHVETTDGKKCRLGE